jgi:hypothetical protein
VATCSAWKLMSVSLQSPGTTMHGPTPPNSAVIGLSRIGVLLALRAAAWSPVPYTMAW